MLSDTKVIALYCIVDDMLKGLRHREDPQVRVSDAEVITTAFVSVLYFGGHWDNARCFMQLKGYVPRMLEKSRFCRRLHRLQDLLFSMFYHLGQHLKDMAGAADYVLDSFPLEACANVRIGRCRLLKGKQWHGRCAGLSRYFYGVRVQVLTLEGVPVEVVLVPGRENDAQALLKLPLQVAPASCVYMDAGYTSYSAEDEALAAEGIRLMIDRRSNSRRKDEPHVRFLKKALRKKVETTFSELKAHTLSCLHAVTEEGFLLKAALLVIAFAFDKVSA
jgi:hypothetical protein